MLPIGFHKPQASDFRPWSTVCDRNDPQSCPLKLCWGLDRGTIQRPVFKHVEIREGDSMSRLCARGIQRVDFKSEGYPTHKKHWYLMIFGLPVGSFKCCLLLALSPSWLWHWTTYGVGFLGKLAQGLSLRSWSNADIVARLKAQLVWSWVSFEKEGPFGCCCHCCLRFSLNLQDSEKPDFRVQNPIGKVSKQPLWCCQGWIQPCLVSLLSQCKPETMEPYRQIATVILDHWAKKSLTVCRTVPR